MLSKSSPFFRCCLVACGALFLFFNAPPSWAQMGSVGTVNVLVVDPSGAAVQGAKLTLQDLATNVVHEAETQQAGNYSFVALPLGTYKLTVSKAGFQNEILNAVVAQGGRVTDVRVDLKVGAATEQVIVESATPLVEATSNAIATTIDMKQIEDLPLQGRDISTLAQLTPGYSGTNGFGTWNGLPVIAQGNTIDGVVSSTSRMKFSGNVQPGLEARLEDIQEMTVESQQVDLSHGMGMASMQVNFVTRRGSNDYHGRIFEDFRNSAMNANSWYNNAIGAPRDPLILNEFGGSVGGPILKDKLFFFGSFAMSKQPGGYLAANAILTPAAQQGILTYQDGTTQVNLFTQVAQPNGLPTTVNSEVAREQGLINKAVSGGTVFVSTTADPNIENINWLVPSPTTKYYPAFRVDYNLSQRFRIDFSFNETKISQPNAAAPPFPGPDFSSQTASNKSNNYIGSLGLNWTITPTLINQFRGGYYYNAAWYAFGAKPTWETQPQVSWGICPAAIPPNYAPCSGQGFNLPVGTYYPVVNVVDNAAWQHGAHSANFGLSFYREQDHYYNAPDGIPNITLNLAPGDPAFNDFEKYFANATDADRGDAENLYASLVGRVSSITPIGSGFPYDPKAGQYAKTAGSTYNLDELQKGWGLYAQDSFRVTPHFTFNYGLRWDFTGDDHDLTSAYHGATLAGLYGPSGIGNVFKPGTLTGIANPTYDASSHQYAPWNVSPQPTIGLAWNPNYSEGVLGKLFGGSDTVVRAGFDIKRFTEPYQYFWNNASNHGMAFFQSFGLNAGSGGAGFFAPGTRQLGEPFSPADPTQFLLSPPAYQASIPQSDFTWNYYWGAAGFDPHIKQPYVQEWNLGIQRQLGRSNVLELRYVGHRSVHQWIQTDPNEINIFENGFLNEFKAAQANLAINLTHGINSFANNGYAGQQALPIFDAAFAGEPSGGTGVPLADYANGGFINDLNRGAAGLLAQQLANPIGQPVPYICNLVGSSLSPCTTQFGYTSPGPYPLNFFQVNPLAAGNAGVTQSWMSAAGYGNYHALQVDFRQKPWHGMQFDVNYTWSHTLGLQPDGQWLGTITEFTFRNLRSSYSPTLFDLRHVVHASGTFDLPVGNGKPLLNRRGLVDKFVGGWSLGTIFSYETGFPFQLSGGFFTFNEYGDGGFALNGITKAQLQNAVGVFSISGPYVSDINPKVLGSPSGVCRSFVTSVCQNVTPGTFGAHIWLYGPRLWNDDLSLTKAIPITEKVRFSLQGEFLNVFNHPNWANPGDGPYYFGSKSIRSSAFGQAGLSNFNGPRFLELRANIEF